MVFKGTPGLAVIDRERNRKVGRFDEDGRMEVTDEIYIAKMKRKFEPVTIHTCKKCGAEFENQGALMTHYKEAHPKEKK